MTEQDCKNIRAVVEFWLDAMERGDCNKYATSQRLSEYTIDLYKLNERKLNNIRDVVQEWVDKQSHEKCWYYPELFKRLATLLDITPTKEPNLPPEPEFEEGCKRYKKEIYEENSLLQAMSVKEEDRDRGTLSDELDSGTVRP